VGTVQVAGADPVGGAKIFGVFRVKNHDFTKKSYFSNCGGMRENCWGISCEKSRFYAKKILFFPILGGGGAPRVGLSNDHTFLPGSGLITTHFFLWVV
jgi:hypothetical protein